MINLPVLLERVKQTGSNRWIAKCPAHDDKNPSLAIRECEDGTVLLKCFAGCDNESIVQALGMELKDLFPNGYSNRHERRPIGMPARDALAAIDHEVTVAWVIAADVLTHREIDAETLDRLSLARSRISSVRASVAPMKVRR